MKKLLLLLAAAAPLLLAAHAIDNRRHPDGTPVLIPRPQRYEARAGVLALPAEFTVSAPKEAANEVELFRRLVARCYPKRTVRQVDKNAFLRLELAKQGVPESDEGYTFEVGAGAVTVRSRSVRGLFYGVQTLGNLFRNADKPELAQCFITDWPDIRTRGVYFERVVTMDHRNMPRLLREFDLLGALKYNAVVLELGEFFPYKNNPFTLRKTCFLPEDIAALNAAAKRNHLEIIPRLQIISHDMWMHAHPRYWEEIAEGIPPETPWSSASCPLRELPRKLFHMAIEEHIEAFHPKRFAIGIDEVAQCPWGICELCRKHSRFDLLKLTLHEYTDLVLKHGISPIIAHDQFYPGLPMQGEKLLPDLDRRITLSIWHYSEVVNSKYFEYFKQFGFPLSASCSSLNPGNLRSMPRMAKKYGVETVIVSHWGNWRALNSEKRVMPDGLAGFTLGANYTWNTSDIPLTGQSYDPGFETRRIYLPKETLEPEDFRYWALPLHKSFNAKLGRDRSFPLTDAKLVERLQRELAGTPEKFHLATAPEGAYFAVKVGKGEGETAKIEIPLPKSRVDVLSFLLAAGIGTDTPDRKRLPLATLTIHYSDGKTKAVPLRQWIELSHWNTASSPVRLRFADRFNDTRGALAGLFVYDWKNPRPKAPIRAVTLEAEGAFGMPVALFAVSAGRRPADPEEKLPEWKPYDNLAARRLTEWSARVEPKEDRSGELVVLPLDKGIPADAKISLTHKDDKMVRSVVDDPTAPTPGKVLRLDIPANAKGETQRQRLIVDILFDRAKLPGEIKTLIFDYKAGSHELLFIPACYLGGPPGEKKGTYRFMPFADRIAPPNRWYTAKIPVDQMTVEGKKIADRDICRVRLSIFFNVHDKPTAVWFANVRLSNKRLSVPPTLRVEKIPEHGEEVAPPAPRPL